MDDKPDIPRKRRHIRLDPCEIGIYLSEEERQARDANSSACRDQMLADVIQFTDHRTVAGDTEQPLLLRNLGVALVEGDELPSLRCGQPGIGAVGIKTETHGPNFSSHATRFLGAYQADGNVCLSAYQRDLIALSREGQADIRMFFM